jgi:DNA polymerase III delta prime subunit
MQSRILIGSASRYEAHIHTFILGNSIPEYAITRLSDSIKIEDIHLLIRKNKMHVGKGEKRLTIFTGIITIPAQNALLKYLEELPNSDYVFFCVESEGVLLETIRSRCNLVYLGLNNTDNTSETTTPKEFLNVLPVLAQNITNKESYYQFVTQLRATILEEILQKKHQVSTELIILLRNLNAQTQYVRENNVNPQFTIESAPYFRDVRFL